MSRYTVDHDKDFDIYYVVCWDNVSNVGNVVHRAYSQAAADDFIVGLLQEENQEIFNEFG